MHSLENKKGPIPKTPKPTPTVSAIVNRDALLEMVYDLFERRTGFVVFEPKVAAARASASIARQQRPADS
jgi:hypothetical protein